MITINNCKSDIDLKSIEFLIENGSNVNIFDCNNFSALLHAIRFCDKKYQLKIVDLLIKNGADINYKKNNLNALEYCIVYFNHNPNLKLIDFLLNNGAKITTNNNKASELFIILMNNFDEHQNIELIKLLIDHQINIFAQKDNGESILTSLFCNFPKHKNIELVAYLIYKNNCNKQDENGNTALMYIVQLKSICNLIKPLEILIKNTDLNLQNKKGDTAFMILFSQKEKIITKIIDLFIENGANLNLRNNNGETVLMKAVEYYSIRKNSGIIKKLIYYGAKPYLKNNNNESAFHLAIKYFCEKYSHDNSNIINELIKYELKLNFKLINDVSFILDNKTYHIKNSYGIKNNLNFIYLPIMNHNLIIENQKNKWTKIFNTISIESDKFLYAPDCLRSTLLNMRFSDKKYHQLSENTKNLILNFFNISDSESFNDKINDVLKWLD